MPAGFTDRLPLSRHRIDRDYLARSRPELFDELLADPTTRVIVLSDGSALLADGGTGLALRAPSDLPTGVARDLAEVERVIAELIEALDGYEKWNGELAMAGKMTPDAWVELDKLHAKACLALGHAEGR